MASHLWNGVLAQPCQRRKKKKRHPGSLAYNAVDGRFGAADGVRRRQQQYERFEWDACGHIHDHSESRIGLGHAHTNRDSHGAVGMRDLKSRSSNHGMAREYSIPIPFFSTDWGMCVTGFRDNAGFTLK